MTGTAPSTLGDLARDMARRLEQAGIAPAEAALDAELLARTALGWDRARWIVEARRPSPADLAARLEPLVVRRERREPMAYVLGRCEFWGREFVVDRRVLIPRPETEIIVEQALARLEPDDAVEIADVGTGSGCLAISIAAERRHARVVAGDISAAALDVARLNAHRHRVSSRVALQLTAGVPAADALDLIVSNPPYIPASDRRALMPEVGAYEPPEALFAGDDGLAVIPSVIDQAAGSLRPGGWLIFEFGFGQADAVRALLDTAEWGEVAIVADLQGIPRTALARRTHR